MVVHAWGTFIYAPPERRQDDFILLPEEEAHHLRHVLRRQAGAEIFATDGAGLVYRCAIADANRLKITETLPDFGEPPVEITLVVGVLKGDCNRDIVDYAVQLGARKIIFAHTIRSEGKLAANKLDRLKKIAISAIKQCGRARLPEITVTDSVAASLRQLDNTACILLAQQLENINREASHAQTANSGMLVACVGPEGGFDASEIATLQTAGAELVHLGGRRLRTATAVCAMLSYCLGIAGEMN